MLAGLPELGDYRVHVKPPYRDRPHLAAWTDFEDRSITLQLPEPFFPFGEIVPYGAKRRTSAKERDPGSSGSPRASRSAPRRRCCGSRTSTSGCTGG